MIIFTGMEDPPLTAFEFLGKEDFSSKANDTFDDASNFSQEKLVDKVLSAVFHQFQPQLHLSKEDIEALNQLHESPLFMPHGHMLKCVQQILIVLTVITILHFIVLALYKHHRNNVEENIQKNVQWKKGEETIKLENRKGSYQMTNLIVNLCLSTTGIYHLLFTLSKNADLIDMIQGWESVLILSCAQIAYQLWAIPIGILMVQESSTMICHHLSVIGICTLSALFTNGFRYFTPFFYGVTEFSSVPLAIMNMFKNHPERIHKMPRLYTSIRVVFALSFLTVRVIMWLPQIFNFWRLAFLFMCTSESTACTTFIIFFMICGFFLTSLQLLWASKIIKGLVKFLGRQMKNFRSLSFKEY